MLEYMTTWPCLGYSILPWFLYSFAGTASQQRSSPDSSVRYLTNDRSHRQWWVLGIARLSPPPVVSGTVALHSQPTAILVITVGYYSPEHLAHAQTQLSCGSVSVLYGWKPQEAQRNTTDGMSFFHGIGVSPGKVAAGDKGSHKHDWCIRGVWVYFS